MPTLIGYFGSRMNIGSVVLNTSLTARDPEADVGSSCKAESIAYPNADPELTLQTSQRADRLRKCLTRLSSTHREIIDLVYYHEKSINELAEIIGVPQNTVKTRMFYARSRLAKLLHQAGVEPATCGRH